VDNSVDQIVVAIQRVAADGGALRAGAARLRERKLTRWSRTKAAIVAQLDHRAEIQPVADEATSK